MSPENILFPSNSSENVGANLTPPEFHDPAFMSNAYLEALTERFTQNKSVQSTSKREYSESLQIVICYEGPYGISVCKLADPNLRDENFEVWDYPTPPDTIFKSIYDRYKYLPLEKWPIICMPMPNMEPINNLITTRYPNLAVVMPYINTGSWFPNQMNFPANTFFKVVLVGAGNQSNDWTTGNKLDFIDSVIIQYVNPEPILNYPIDSVVNNGGYTKVYSTLLPWYASVGSQVWFNIRGTSGSFYNRYCVLEKSTTQGWVKIYQQNVAGFTSGSAKSHFLSGSTFSNGAYLNKIMRSCSSKFKNTVKVARMSGSNRGIQNVNTGYGRINVKDAIYTYSSLGK